MRVSEQVRTERKGLRKVRDAFEGIGWGPVPNPEHDLGTDLLVMARDERRFDRALIVGAQVKAGPHYFKDCKRAKGESVAGWWYYEPDANHFDDWVIHCLPHLLVLHNLEEGKSYWAHVTADEVVSTGKGCKILVPEHQTIDEEHADDLFRVACAQRSAPELEGTAFEGLADGVPPGRRLRYALVAPRLVAPHPNARQDDPIGPVQAAALLAQGRFGDLLLFAEKHRSVPDPQQPYSGREWGWSLVTAFWHWAFTDHADRLEEALASARTPAEGAASGVLLACALHREGRCGRALEVLNGLIGGDTLAPADHGWALVQRARLRTETGDFDGCRDDAAEAQRCLRGDADDVTVSALAAAAAWQLYAAAFLADLPDWDEWDSEFNRLVAASDTAVSWWRAQTVSLGLSDAEKSRFDSWADPFPRNLFRWEGMKAQYLFAAEFSADITGAHSRWKHACAQYGRQRLMGASDSDDDERKLRELAEGLSALRRSGDDKSLEKAIRRLRHDGPIGPVAEVVNKIPLTGWTHTTADPNFAALARAGDLVEESAATELACWGVAQVDHPAELNERLKPSRAVSIAALEAVTGLLPAAAAPAHTAAARLIAGLPAPPLHMAPQHVCNAIRQLDYDRVDAETRQALWENARNHQGWISATMLAWLAANDHQKAVAEAVGRAAAGDLDSLGAVADLASLDPGDASAIIGHLAEAADRNLADARNGTHSGDRIDAVWWLIRMGFEFPDLVRWDKALELLCDPHVAGHDKRDACLLASEKPDKLPDDVRYAIADGADTIAVAQPGVGFEADMGGIATVLAVGLGSLAGGDAATAMAKLAVGTPEQRRDAAILLGWGRVADQQPMLAVLAGDPHPEVRIETAWAIGRLAAGNPTPPLCVLAWEMARSDGILVPAALFAGLAASEGPESEIAVDIAQHLRQHPSAIIRNWSQRILR
ncbi:MAG: DUF4365 domain-containing protein [Acidimicrobiia bacterium]|nr:DUF4365 domain-containing protein [Acidimicrobiia bacterium]MCY4434562.1 DUF4365 domain-containing protein [bacterium]